MKRKFVLAATFCLLLSCSKPEEEETCEDKNTTKVTFSNTTSNAVRVVVSESLTPQFEPVNVKFAIDLAPGQSVLKEFTAGRYVNSWYNNCPSTCSRMNNIFRTFESCKEYEEKK